MKDSDWPEGLNLSYLRRELMPKLRFGEKIPSKCDWNHRPDLEHVWGKEPHFWMPVTLAFNGASRRGLSSVYQDDLPNWTICNRCYIVNPDRRYCEEAVMNNYSSGACGRQAKTEENGKWYCGTHIPSVRAGKRAQKLAEWNAKWDAQKARDKRNKEKSDAEKSLVKLARETVEWLEKSGLNEDDEWGKTLYHRMIHEIGVLDEGTH